MKAFGILVCLLAGVCACSRGPGTLPVPEQRPEMAATSPAQATVPMADINAEAHFVRDISPVLEGVWRWTGREPAVTVMCDCRKNVDFVIDFTVPGAALAQTGPVTLRFSVNGHEVGTRIYKKDGRQLLRLPVPAEWLKPDDQNVLSASIDKLFVPQPGAPGLGFILIGMGLETQ